MDIENIRNKTVGSRGEGLAKMYESDWDMLFIDNETLVTEDRIATESIPESVTVFHMVLCLTYPCYSKLLLIRHGTEFYFPEGVLLPLENRYWISR